MTLMARQYEKGVKAERERIIALLEAKANQVKAENAVEMDWDDHREEGIRIATALVKGEN